MKILNEKENLIMGKKGTQVQNTPTQQYQIPYWEMIQSLNLKKERKNYGMLCKNHNPRFPRWTYNRYISKQMYLTYDSWNRHMNEVIGRMQKNELKELKYYAETQVKLTETAREVITNEASPFVGGFIGSLITVMLTAAVESNPTTLVLLPLFIMSYLVLYGVIGYVRTKRAYNAMFYSKLLTIVMKYI